MKPRGFTSSHPLLIAFIPVICYVFFVVANLAFDYFTHAYHEFATPGQVLVGYLFLVTLCAVINLFLHGFKTFALNIAIAAFAIIFWAILTFALVFVAVGSIDHP